VASGCRRRWRPRFSVVRSALSNVGENRARERVLEVTRDATEARRIRLLSVDSGDE
jgi:hypothetical protein